MNTPAFDQARFNRVRWTVFWTLIASYIMVFLSLIHI